MRTLQLIIVIEIYICINFDIHMYIHKLTNNRTLKQSISGNRLL